ncbi:MAG: lysophospholipid acyltransferase family protein [Betaproteobacteria bacterium]|nr:MAG: lysophospholipid acyltransferase family protein [Betaproteobacteria bacterium]
MVARLPLPLVHALGAVLGWMVYLGSPRYRRDFRANLATAGLSGFRLRCSAVAEAGKSAMEVPAVWLRPLGRVAGLVVEVNGWEYVDAGARRGKGVIIVTPHIGCWEIVGQYVASRMPITVMYRAPKIEVLEPLMRIGRSRGAAMKSITADVRGVRAMLKALKRGEAIGLLPDQVPGIGEGEWVEFFGRPAYTMTLVGRIAEQTGAAVLLCCAQRLPRGRGYRFFAEPMLAPRPPESAVRALNRSLERLIRRHPEQYLWGYNRYKVPAGVLPPDAR